MAVCYPALSDLCSLISQDRISFSPNSGTSSRRSECDLFYSFSSLSSFSSSDAIIVLYADTYNCRCSSECYFNIPKSQLHWTVTLHKCLSKALTSVTGLRGIAFIAQDWTVKLINFAIWSKGSICRRQEFKVH